MATKKQNPYAQYAAIRKGYETGQARKKSPEAQYAAIRSGYAKASAPAPATSPAPAQDTGVDTGSGYGGYGGYGGGGGYGAAVAAAPVAPRLSDDEWLAQDSAYKSQLAALDQKLKDFEVENASAKKKGTQDYETNLDRMGWLRDKNTWDAEDRSKAYGAAYQDTMGSFASRGLMQSTLYDQERNNLMANFTQQKTDMDSAQTNFLEELARALSTQQTNTRLGKDQARVEALARRAAAESGVA